LTQRHFDVWLLEIDDHGERVQTTDSLGQRYDFATDHRQALLAQGGRDEVPLVARIGQQHDARLRRESRGRLGRLIWVRHDETTLDRFSAVSM